MFYSVIPVGIIILVDTDFQFFLFPGSRLFNLLLW